jgi:hypothetical protein
MTETRKSPKTKCDATGYVLGQPIRETFEHDTDTGLSANRQAVLWAQEKGVSVLETAKPPYRNKDRNYYATNPSTGKMNRISFNKAKIITAMIPAMFAEEGAESEEDKRQIVERVIRREISGVPE